MIGKLLIEPARILRRAGEVTLDPNALRFTLENHGNDVTRAEVVLDYQQCEGGLPIFVIECASGDGSVEVAIVYSEGIEGVDHETGTNSISMRRVRVAILTASR
jgi:hypothetical protein